MISFILFIYEYKLYQGYIFPMQKLFENANEFNSICYNACNKFTRTSHGIIITRGSSLLFLFLHYMKKIFLYICSFYFCLLRQRQAYKLAHLKIQKKNTIFLVCISISQRKMKENYLKIGAGTLLHLHFEINVLLPSHFLHSYIMEKRIIQNE